MIGAFIIAATLSMGQETGQSTLTKEATPPAAAGEEMSKKTKSKHTETDGYKGADSLSAPVMTDNVAPPAEPDPFLETASIYASFFSEVSEAGRRELAAPQDIDASFSALTAFYHEDHLPRGQTAYSGLLAAETPQFADAVRDIADFYGVDATAHGLLHDPLYVTGFDGASDAAAAVEAANAEDIALLDEVSLRYREAGYNLQLVGWAKAALDDSVQLARLETGPEQLNISVDLNAPETGIQDAGFRAASSLFPRDVAIDGSGVSLDDLRVSVGERQLTPDERRMGQILVAAALRSIEDGDSARLDEAMINQARERCMLFVRLNLAQCVKAGRQKFEDAFCLAEHGLTEVADCLVTAKVSRDDTES